MRFDSWISYSMLFLCNVFSCLVKAAPAFTVNEGLIDRSKPFVTSPWDADKAPGQRKYEVDFRRYMGPQAYFTVPLRQDFGSVFQQSKAYEISWKTPKVNLLSGGPTSGTSGSFSATSAYTVPKEAVLGLIEANSTVGYLHTVVPIFRSRIENNGSYWWDVADTAPGAWRLVLVNAGWDSTDAAVLGQSATFVVQSASAANQTAWGDHAQIKQLEHEIKSMEYALSYSQESASKNTKLAGGLGGGLGGLLLIAGCAFASRMNWFRNRSTTGELPSPTNPELDAYMRQRETSGDDVDSLAELNGAKRMRMHELSAFEYASEVPGDHNEVEKRNSPRKVEEDSAGGSVGEGSGPAAPGGAEGVKEHGTEERVSRRIEVPTDCTDQAERGGDGGMI